MPDVVNMKPSANPYVEPVIPRQPERKPYHRMAEKADAWRMAKELADVIVAEDGVEPYKVSGVDNSYVTITRAEQHAAVIERIADWLLREDY